MCSGSQLVNSRARFKSRHSEPDYYSCLVSNRIRLFCDPKDYSLPVSMGFPGQEYCSRLPFASTRDFLTQELNLCLLCLLHRQVDSLPESYLGSLVNSKVGFKSRHSEDRFSLLIMTFHCLFERHRTQSDHKEQLGPNPKG